MWAPNSSKTDLLWLGNQRLGPPWNSETTMLKSCILFHTMFYPDLNPSSLITAAHLRQQVLPPCQTARFLAQGSWKWKWDSGTWVLWPRHNGKGWLGPGPDGSCPMDLYGFIPKGGGNSENSLRDRTMCVKHSLNKNQCPAKLFCCSSCVFGRWFGFCRWKLAMTDRSIAAAHLFWCQHARKTKPKFKTTSLI